MQTDYLWLVFPGLIVNFFCVACRMDRATCDELRGCAVDVLQKFELNAAAVLSACALLSDVLGFCSAHDYLCSLDLAVIELLMITLLRSRDGRALDTILCILVTLADVEGFAPALMQGPWEQALVCAMTGAVTSGMPRAATSVILCVLTVARHELLALRRLIGHHFIPLLIEAITSFADDENILFFGMCVVGFICDTDPDAARAAGVLPFLANFLRAHALHAATYSGAMICMATLVAESTDSASAATEAVQLGVITLAIAALQMDHIPQDTFFAGSGYTGRRVRFTLGAGPSSTPALMLLIFLRRSRSTPSPIHSTEYHYGF